MIHRPPHLLGLFFAATAAGCLAPDAVPGGGSSGSSTGTTQTQGGGGSTSSSSGTTGGGGGAGAGTGMAGSAGSSPTPDDLAWARSYGVDFNDLDQRARSAAVSPSGSVILAGDFEGSLTFDPLPALPNTVARDAFVAEIAADGTPAWSVAFAGNGEQRAHRALSTSDGGVVVAGSFTEALFYDGADQAMAPDNEEGFVASLAPDRSLRWIVFVHGPGSQAVHALAITPDGGAAIAGHFDDALHVGDLDGAASTGGRDLFVAKIAADGKPVWTTALGADPATLPFEIPPCVLAAAEDGTLRVAGSFTGTLSLAGDHAAQGDRDAFVGALDADGKPLWGHAAGASGRQQRAVSVAVTSAGETVLTGDVRGEVSLAGATLTSDGDQPDAFLALLDPKGDLVWARRFGSEAEDHGGPAAVDPSGDILFAGRFRGAISFSGDDPFLNSQSQAGSDDLFLAKLDKGGKARWALAFGKDQSQIPTSIAVRTEGGFYLAGFFSGLVDFGSGDLDATSGDDIFIARFGE